MLLLGFAVEGIGERVVLLLDFAVEGIGKRCCAAYRRRRRGGVPLARDGEGARRERKTESCEREIAGGSEFGI